MLLIYLLYSVYTGCCLANSRKTGATPIGQLALNTPQSEVSIPLLSSMHSLYYAYHVMSYHPQRSLFHFFNTQHIIPSPPPTP